MVPYSMLIAVFSYNRGRYLYNVINSIERNLGNIHPLRIYDDNSECRTTRRVLSAFATKYKVTKPSGKSLATLALDGKRSLGGLSVNLQQAYEDAQIEGVDYLLAIQDDMQVVRALDAEFFEVCDRILEDPQVVQIKPKFISGKPTRESPLGLHESGLAYFPRHRNRISPTGLSSIRRLQDRRWSFLRGHGENEALAEELNIYHVIHRDPFLAHLPWPAPHRKRYFRLYSMDKPSPRLALFANEQFYPLKDLGDDEVRALKERPIDTLPYEMDWLKVRGSRPPVPWTRYVVPLRKRVRRCGASLFYNQGDR